MKIVGYFGLLIIIGVSVVAGTWYWKNYQNQTVLPDTVATSQALPPEMLSEVPAPSNASVLGVSEELLLPNTLYGLINGLRRDVHVSQLSVNPSLEKTAQLLLNQPSVVQNDSTELAKSLGFSGKGVAELRAAADHSSWKLFTQLQADPRNAMLMQSPTFSEVGAAIICQQEFQSQCTVLVILGEK